MKSIFKICPELEYIRIIYNMTLSWPFFIAFFEWIPVVTFLRNLIYLKMFWIVLNIGVLIKWWKDTELTRHIVQQDTGRNKVSIPWGTPKNSSLHKMLFNRRYTKPDVLGNKSFVVTHSVIVSWLPNRVGDPG